MIDIKKYALVNVLECIEADAEKQGEEKITLTLNREDVIEIVKDMHSADKYRWHDLRKNPDDLPKEDHEVEVIANMLCKWDKQYRDFTIRMSYTRKIMYGKPIGWGVGYPYDFDFETDHVIAWREIEPFEEV